MSKKKANPVEPLPVQGAKKILGGKAYQLKRVSDFGESWQPKKPGDSIAGIIEARTWVDDPDGAYPLTNIVNPDTGAISSIRTDFAFLRVVEKVPRGGVVMITYEGLGKRKGKNNPPKRFAVDIGDCELSETSLQPEYKGKGLTTAQLKEKRNAKRRK